MDYRIRNWKYGTINRIEGESIPAGSASDSLNWITNGDLIEVRRGSKIIGTSQTGTGKITGLHVAQDVNGTEVLFMSKGQTVSYYDTTTEDFIEIGTNILGTDADGEDVSFTDYSSLAGNALYFSSPNSSLFKVMVANPASYSDLYDSTKNFKGYIKIKQNRMWLWNRLEDKTGVYGSRIDTENYTTVTAEATTSLTGTLAFKAGGAKRTCFGIELTITATSEVYTDNYDGTLTGSAGGTGTINYTSGAYTISNAGVGTVDYQWVDDTVLGIADFTKSSPRVASEGFVFRQDDGGILQNIFSYGDVEYCVHEKKTWVLTLTADDTNASNLIYRDNVGIPNWQGAVSTGDGIYLVDVVTSEQPKFKLLTLATGSDKIIPIDVTLNYDFSNYRFDNAKLEEWDDYIVIHCRHKDSSRNNTTFLWNKIWKTIDRTNYYAYTSAIYNGAYMLGDSLTDNVWEAFSGFDDDDAGITNYWESNIDELGMINLKKVKRLRIRGLIAKTMKIKVYMNPDNSGYTEIGEIKGLADYVDIGTAIYIGANTIGSKEVGGGSDGVYAYKYETEFKVNLDKFQDVKFKFIADETNVGYASVSDLNFYRIKKYKNKLPTKYR